MEKRDAMHQMVNGAKVRLIGGDEVYHFDGRRVISEADSGGTITPAYMCNGDYEIVMPKVKRTGWLNIYPASCGCHLSFVHDSEDAANSSAKLNRVDCIEITWHEEVSSEHV